MKKDYVDMLTANLREKEIKACLCSLTQLVNHLIISIYYNYTNR